MSLRIAIYSDKQSKTDTDFLAESIQEVLGKSIKFLYLDRHHLKKLTELNPDIFIVPGVRGIHCDYDTVLRDHIAETIMRYVENGGAYVGFCAGAYYLLEDILFFSEDGTFISKRNPFGPIEGQSIGPVHSELNFDIHSAEWHDHAVREICIVENLKKGNGLSVFHALYASGPTFRSRASDAFNTIAYFTDNSENPPALITKPFGKGIFIGSSLCPQFSIGDYRDINLRNLSESDRQKLMRVMHDLERYDQSRQNLMRYILKEALKFKETERVASFRRAMLQASL